MTRIVPSGTGVSYPILRSLAVVSKGHVLAGDGRTCPFRTAARRGVRHDREQNGEGRALVPPGALDRDRSSMRLHQRLTDRQTQPQPAKADLDVVAPLLEGIEDDRELLRVDADAGVGDLDADPAAGGVGGGDGDAAGLGRE